MFPGRQQKRRLAEEEEKEDGGGKKVKKEENEKKVKKEENDERVKKEENENVYRIFAKNLRKADEEQGDGIAEMERMVVTIVGKEGPLGSQRSPTSAGLIHCIAPPQQTPSTAKLLPITALKQVCTQTLKIIR